MNDNDVIEEDRVIVRILGKLDVVASKAFEARLLTHVDGPQRLVVVDFSGCDYVSSAGLRSILIGAKRARATNKELVLAGMNKVVRDVFRVSGFDRMLQVEPDVASALARHG